MAAFLALCWEDYLACQVLEAFLVGYLDVLGLQAFAVWDDLGAYCSGESWVHCVGWGSYFVTSLMAFLVHPEAFLEHQEGGQTCFLMMEDLQVAFLGPFLGYFVASLAHLVAFLGHLLASQDHQVASLDPLEASLDHLIASQGHREAFQVHLMAFLDHLEALLIFLLVFQAYFQAQKMAFFLLLGS